MFECAFDSGLPFLFTGICDAGSEISSRYLASQDSISVLAEASISCSCLTKNDVSGEFGSSSGTDDKAWVTITATGTLETCCGDGPSGSNKGLASRVTG